MHSIFLIDGYKADHRSQYPKGTEYVYSNFTARKSMNPEITKVVVFGIQYFIKKYLIEDFNQNFFGVDKSAAVAAYKDIMDGYIGPDKITTEHIAELHDLGYLPIKIKALPEGSRCPMGVPFVTVVNTDKRFGWLTNYLETIMSCILWGPMTSATVAFQFRKIMTEYAVKTGSSLDFVKWQGHDFSFRGMFGLEAALMSGAAHLTSFTGTDTIPAIHFAKKYYNAEGLIGGSVPATEHSVASANGENNEWELYRRLIEDVYPSGIVSVVSDTWDYWNVLTNIVPSLKDSIMKRDGKLVVRPDSGDPVLTIVGNPDATVDSSEHKGTVELLWDTFGGTVTDKGYKVLDPHIGTILGDGVTLDRCKRIFEGLEKKGFAASNIVLGVGSFSYQYCTRDTFGTAMKATHCVINGESRAIFKNPKTDTNKLKKSARGLLSVIKEDGEYKLLQDCTPEQETGGCLEVVFKDGVLTKDQTFSEIRARIDSEIAKITGV
jgi:nicotinamide phosphoribosyltransferase